MKNRKQRKNKKNFIYFIIITIVLVIISWIALSVIYKQFIYPKRYEEFVEKSAKEYNIDPYLIYAVIKQESGFDELAVSKANAKGLMQIVESTADDLVRGIDELDKNLYSIFDPETNITLGTKYLSYLITRYSGNYYIALAAYNAGMGTVDKWFQKPYEDYDSYVDVVQKIKYNETRTYVTNIIKYYDYYKKIYSERGLLL